MKRNLVKENKIPLYEGVYDPGILKALNYIRLKPNDSTLHAYSNLLR